MHGGLRGRARNASEGSGTDGAHEETIVQIFTIGKRPAPPAAGFQPGRRVKRAVLKMMAAPMRGRSPAGAPARYCTKHLYGCATIVRVNAAAVVGPYLHRAYKERDLSIARAGEAFDE